MTARQRSNEAREDVAARLGRLGFTGALQKIETWLKNEPAITINFQPDGLTPSGEKVIDAWQRDPFYRTAGDERNGRAVVGALRRDWEQAFLGPDSNERPTYGALNIYGHPAGSAPVYGAAHFVLKPEVTRHATISNMDSAGAGKQGFELGTPSHALHLLSSMSDSNLGNIARRAVGMKVVGDPIVGELAADFYLETQIYRPLDLRRDVQAVVLNESEVSAETALAVRALAKRLGATYQPVSSKDVRSFLDQFK